MRTGVWVKEMLTFALTCQWHLSKITVYQPVANNIFRLHYFALLLFSEKVTKSRPKSNTARFRNGAMIKLCITVISAIEHYAFSTYGTPEPEPTYELINDNDKY